MINVLVIVYCPNLIKNDVLESAVCFLQVDPTLFGHISRGRPETGTSVMLHRVVFYKLTDVL